MIWSCSYCGTILRLWKVKCPNCKKNGISWLHVAVIGALTLSGVVYLLEIF